MNAPIALFAYKRPYELEQTLNALKNNYLAAESELYVFVDGPKRPEDRPKVAQVCDLVREITGFRRVTLHVQEENQGCANSVIRGVTYVLSRHPSVIVVEDDIVTAPNFLDYMNQCLVAYGGQQDVFSIGGYSFPFDKPAGYPDDVYFIGRTCAWGWAIWADRWQQADWNVTDFDAFMHDPAQRTAFNRNGSDRVRMLRRTMHGELDAWDIRLCYTQFKLGSLTTYPTTSKVQNIGFYGSDGVNTNVYNRYQTILDEGQQRTFCLPDKARVHPYYTKRFRQKYSLGVRLLNRLKTYAGLR